MVLGMLVAALGPTLGALAEQTHSPLREISLLFIARSLGYMLGSIWVGSFYDRVRGNLLLSWGLVSSGLMVTLTPFIDNLWALILLFLLQGMTGSIVHVGGNTLLVWANRERLGPLLNGLHFIWGVGASLSPILMAQTMIRSGGITVGYIFLACLTLPVFFWLVRLPSPENMHQEERDPEDDAPLSLVILIGAFLFLYTGVEAGMGSWIYTFALGTNLMQAAEAAYLNSAFWGTLTLGRLAIIPLATRLRPRVILLMALSGALASVSILLLAGQSRGWIWVGVAGLGFSFASIFPTTLSFAERRMNLSGKLTGRFFACSSGGAMVLPWLIGQFYESRGPRVLLWAVWGGVFLAGIIFYFMVGFPRKTEVKAPAH